jgi:isopenicillin N synthase-like dioxygenase
MTIEELAAPSAMHSLTSDGFLMVSIPDGIRTAIDSTFRRGAAFFRQTVEAKMTTSLAGDLGFRAYGVEYSSSPERPDQMESFTISRRCADRLRQLPNMSGRVLSSDMAHTLEFFASVATSLIRSLAHFFGQDSDGLLSSAVVDWSILQLNYSRPSRAHGEYINEVHEDGCLLTVASVTGHGLEIQHNRGVFVPVTPAHDQLLIFPGEILYLLSAGLIKPCYHRVNALDYLPERMSLLLFADVDPNLCEPWVTGDVNRGVNIGERVLKNSLRFGLNEWAAK